MFLFFELIDCICICIGREIITTRYKLDCCFLFFRGEGGNLQFFFVNILSAIVFLITGIFLFAVTKPSCVIPMDIVFLLDSSGNAGELGYQAQKDFVSLFTNKIAVSFIGSRVGIVSYSLQARLDVRFEDYDNSTGLRSVLPDLKFLGGSPRIDVAFHMAFVELFTAYDGSRPGFPRVMVLLTAGMVLNITDYETLRFAVEPFKGEGIAVIAVGVGQTADLQRLRVLVDNDELILAAPSFQGLSDLSVDLTLLACKAAGKLACNANWQQLMIYGLLYANLSFT